MKSAVTLSFSMLLSLAGTASSLASNDPVMDRDIIRIAETWAHIKYEVKDRNEQHTEITTLDKDASALRLRYPNRAEPLVWYGIINSEEAAMSSGFTALGFAKSSRDLFEKAGAIDPNVLDGAVPLSLGTLYYRVPGFPIAFGNDARARQYFEQAVAIAANGLDVGYFYGDFLIEQHEYDKARRILQKGLQAPVTADRPIWDTGRRREIRELLAQIPKQAEASR